MDVETKWLWDCWVPRGHLSMICGPPGSEKSTIAAWIATTVLRGSGRFPDGAQLTAGAPNWVTWVNTESTHLVLIDRLTQMGAPLEHVRWPVDPDDNEVCPAIDLTQDRWLKLVASAVAQRRPAWVIVDAIVPPEGRIVPWIRRALEVLASVARDVGCAVTILFQRESLPRGPEDPRQWASVAGKTATVLALKRWGPATKDMKLVVIKTAFGDRPDPLRLRFDSGLPEVVHRPITPPVSRVDKAVAFLERELGGGPRSAFEVTDRAWWQDMIKPRTLQRAKRQLEVKSYRAAGRWWWIR